LTAAVAEVAAEIVAGESGDRCDLAVAEDPGPDELAALPAALAPGGTCYTEWGRAAPAAAARALESAGFVDVTCCRRILGADGLPVLWMPLHAPGAKRYVRGRLLLPGGRVRRLLAGLFRRLRDLLRGRWRSAFSVLARRPSPGLEDEREPAAWLRAGWTGWGLGPGAPERLSTALLTGGPRTVSKIVLLAFAEPDPVPRIAVKTPRVARAVAGVTQEAAVLDHLTRRGAPAGVPRLLFQQDRSGIPYVGETFVEGRPLQGRLTRSSHRSWALRVTDWLASLAAGGPTRSAGRWQETVVEPALARFEERFGAVAHPQLHAASSAIVRSIGALPVVPEQRDCGPWNLLETPEGGLAVLDWESATVEGLPAMDLLYYLAYAAFDVDGARDRDARIASYRSQLDPTTATGTVRRDCLTRYREALGLPKEQLDPLGVLVWLVHAPSDFRHAEADAGGTPSRAALERSLFLALWAEEVRRIDGGGS
jgi:aminoglycoside phosphotransferase (APT) family kinase protein